MPDPSGLLSLNSAPGLVSQLPFLVAMVAIFYFLVWRPQRQEQEQQEKLVASIQKGDRVVTQAGIYGTVLEAAGDALILEISKGCQMTVERASVRRRVEPTDAGAKQDSKPTLAKS